MQPQETAYDQDLCALIGMLGPEALGAFTDAVVAHFLTVADQWPASLQDHILRITYLTWCRERALPYVVVSRASGCATLLLNIGHMRPDRTFDLGEYFLRRVAPCSLPDTVAVDRGGRFVADLPASCAAGIAADLYRAATSD